MERKFKFGKRSLAVAVGAAGALALGVATNNEAITLVGVVGTGYEMVRYAGIMVGPYGQLTLHPDGYPYLDTISTVEDSPQSTPTPLEEMYDHYAAQDADLILAAALQALQDKTL
jgi:hypothetical protein